VDTAKDKIYEVLINTREVDFDRISSLDSTTFTIKGWTVTLVTALIGLAIQQSSNVFLYIGIGVTIIFAIFDFFYRKIQLSHVERVVQIEKYLVTQYLSGVEVKDLKKSFDSFNKNPGKNLTKDYLATVFLVYLVIVCVLICLLFFQACF
jgi:uncharacterized membrane protein